MTTTTTTLFSEDRDPVDALFGLVEDYPGLSDGVRAAYEHADEAWRNHAETALLDCIATGEPFTVDDIRARGVEEPDKHQRWGSLFAFGVHHGWIQRQAWAECHPGKGDPIIVRVWAPGPNAPRVGGGVA